MAQDTPTGEPRVDLDVLSVKDDDVVTSHRGPRFTRTRRRQTTPFPAGILVDRTTEYTHHFARIEAPIGERLLLAMRGVREIEVDRLGGLVARRPGEWWWMPVPPAIRRWDGAGRLLFEQELKTTRHREGDLLLLDLRVPAESGAIELSWLSAPEGTGLGTQILAETAAERRHYALVHVDYAGLGDVWRYLLDGAVYQRGHPIAGRRSRNEQAALILYELVETLYRVTGKSIYNSLLDQIAYAVLLAQGDDGRWRHGLLTDAGEMHTRLQAEAVLVLLHHHRRTGDPALLQGARAGMDDLAGIAETLTGDSVWFLHDTLELDPRLARSIYHYERSNAFGKSTGNTLCLNTHLRTLEALAMLHAVTGDRDHRELLVRGLDAARKVLDARPAEPVYRLAVALRHRLDRQPLSSRGWLWSFGERAERRVFKRLKTAAPRIAMPGGFLERDLVKTAHHLFYHFQNLKDLVCLYRWSPERWMTGPIQDGIRWALERDLGPLIDLYPGCASILAVQGMTTALGLRKADPVDTLVAGAQALHTRGIPTPIDLVTCTLTGTEVRRLRDLDPRLVPVGLGDQRLLIVNPSHERLGGIPPGDHRIERD